MGNIMTEQEWLAQSDAKKHRFIRKKIVDLRHDDYFEMTDWEAFGLIVEKLGNKDSWHLRQLPTLGYRFRVFTEYFEGYGATATTPWEAAALAYGKMKGLIK